MSEFSLNIIQCKSNVYITDYNNLLLVLSNVNRQSKLSMLYVELQVASSFALGLDESWSELDTTCIASELSRITKTVLYVDDL